MGIDSAGLAKITRYGLAHSLSTGQGQGLRKPERPMGKLSSVFTDTIEPLATRYLAFNQASSSGFLSNLANILIEPLTAINESLSLMGIPLLKNFTRTNARAQTTAWTIGDLQVKVAAIEANARKIDQTICEQAVLEVLEFDVIRREFQISQEVVQRFTEQESSTDKASLREEAR